MMKAPKKLKLLGERLNCKGTSRTCGYYFTERIKAIKPWEINAVTRYARRLSRDVPRPGAATEKVFACRSRSA